MGGYSDESKIQWIRGSVANPTAGNGTTTERGERNFGLESIARVQRDELSGLFGGISGLSGEAPQIRKHVWLLRERR